MRSGVEAVEDGCVGVLEGLGTSGVGERFGGDREVVAAEFFGDECGSYSVEAGATAGDESGDCKVIDVE